MGGAADLEPAAFGGEPAHGREVVGRARQESVDDLAEETIAVARRQAAQAVQALPVEGVRRLPLGPLPGHLSGAAVEGGREVRELHGLAEVTVHAGRETALP